MGEMIFSAGLGALIGLFGSFLSNNLKLRKLQNERIFDGQKETLDKLADTIDSMAKSQVGGAPAAAPPAKVASAGAPVPSTSSTELPVWVEIVKTLFRPLLTLLLLALLTWVVWLVASGKFMGLDSATVIEGTNVVSNTVTVTMNAMSTVYKPALYLVESIVIITTSVIAWWFGDRAMVHRLPNSSAKSATAK